MACTSVSYENNCLFCFIFFFGLSEFWQELYNIYQNFWLEVLWWSNANQSHYGPNKLQIKSVRFQIYSHIGCSWPGLSAKLSIKYNSKLRVKLKLLVRTKASASLTYFLHNYATGNKIHLTRTLAASKQEYSASSVFVYHKIKMR